MKEKSIAELPPLTDQQLVTRLRNQVAQQAIQIAELRQQLAMAGSIIANTNAVLAGHETQIANGLQLAAKQKE